MDSATDLPFLFVQGDWIWKVGIAGCGVLGAMLALSLRAVLARARMKAERNAMRRYKASDEVCGTLRGAAGRANAVVAQTISAAPISLKLPRGHAHVRDEALTLHAEDGRVIELIGPVHVFASAESVFTRGGVPAVLSDEDLERAKESLPWLDRGDSPASPVYEATLHRLRDGERVIVRGAVASGASAQESTFRSANVRWTMSGDGGPLAACARKPRRARISRALAAPLTGAVMCALLGFAVQRSLGEQWGEACDEERYALDSPRGATRAPLPFDNWHPCVKSSATSADRQRALEQMSVSLQQTFERSEPGFQQMIAATRLAEGCDAALKILSLYERYEQAAELARQCGARRALHLALVDLGRFEEAAQVDVREEQYMPALPTTSTLILAGRWHEAAAVLDRIANGLAPSDLEAATAAATHRCHALLLRHFANNPSALPALRETQRSSARVECLPMLIEASGEAERRALLANIDDNTWRLLSREGRQAIALQRAIDTQSWSEPDDRPELALTRPSYSDASDWLPMLWAAKLAAPPTSQPSRLPYLRWRSLAHLVDDKNDLAERTASEALTLLPTEPRMTSSAPYLLAVVRYFQNSVDFPLGGPSQEELPDYLWPGVSSLLARKGLLVGNSLVMRGGEEIKAAYAKALQGDASTFVQELDELGDLSYLLDGILAALPRVTKGREALVNTVIWDHHPHASYRRWPFAVAARLFSRREILQAAGAEKQASRTADIYRRLDAALMDRRRLLSLVMLDMFRLESGW